MTEEWVTPKEACFMLDPERADARGAMRALIKYAGANLIDVSASYVEVSRSDGKVVDIIPGIIWDNLLPESDWTFGYFSGQWVDADGWAWRGKVMDVKFSRSGIQKYAPKVLPPTVESVPDRGRKPITDWEKVMVQMAAQLYKGDLQPKYQADIEKAISQVILNNGDNVSESTIRSHAKPLWMAIEAEVRK